MESLVLTITRGTILSCVADPKHKELQLHTVDRISAEFIWIWLNQAKSIKLTSVEVQGTVVSFKLDSGAQLNV